MERAVEGEGGTDGASKYNANLLQVREEVTQKRKRNENRYEISVLA